MEMAQMRYRSVKFECKEKGVQDVDIVQALMVQCDVSEIERVHPMLGNIWGIFATEQAAEEATNGLILKEARIHRKLIGQRFIIATVAYAPANATLGDIECTLTAVSRTPLGSSLLCGLVQTKCVRRSLRNGGKNGGGAGKLSTTLKARLATFVNKVFN